MRYLSLSVALCFASVASANAPDIEREAAPEPVPQVAKVPVNIKYEVLRGDAAGAKAKIVIPRNLLPGAAPAAEEQGALRPIGGTVIAGISLSLAAVSLLWLRRGKLAHRKLFLVLVSGALALGGISALFADIAPPGGGKRPPRRLPEDRPAPAKTMILLEIVADGDAITLTLPPR